MNSAAHREFKDRLFGQFARIGKALAGPRRLEIVDLLAQGERTVEEIARETDMSVASASQHLQALKSARMVEARREGLYVHYRLADEDVFRTWQAVRSLAESRLSEVDSVVEAYLVDRDALEAVDATELMERLSNRNVVVLDVRPEQEYRAGHIPGALSVPVDALEAALQTLPKDKEIVAYCRGPYCVFSDEAVALLRSHGYRARRLRQGLPDWRAAGMPIEGQNGESNVNKGNIDVMVLRDMLERGERVTVVDVRKGEDRAEGSIPGSVHVDAYDALNAGDERAMEGLELPEGAPVVTVCGRGRSSAVAAEQLRCQGYEAFSLEGGMKAWSLAWNTADVPLPGARAEVMQVRRTGKGCLSYVVGSDGEAIVIDAALEPEVYVHLADRRGWQITRVLDSHVHADHLSRSRRLAELTGATLHMPEGAPIYYPFTAVGDGDTVGVGTATLDAVRTPGHTPESTSYLLDGQALFTGDTLFLSAVGRPDLDATPEASREKARDLYRSLGRLLDLDPETLVLPGHTSEPVAFDGESICAPLWEVQESIRVLREAQDAFVEEIAGHVSPTPSNFERIVELNRAGEAPEGYPTEPEAGANRCAAG